MGVVLIAHQRTDYKAANQNPTNLSSAGLGTFYKMIDAEYFDSLEVRSSKVEGILKNRFMQDCIFNQTLISGSDCHDWNCYPFHDKNCSEKPMFVTMKAEPSFRGLVMSITNINRFFAEDIPNKKPFIENIKLETNGQKQLIPLSFGINAIIGDNSVGKSTLIKMLFGKAPQEAVDFYNNHNIIVEKLNIIESDYQLNLQSDIRKKFEKNESKLALKEEFNSLFKEIDIKMYSNIIESILEKFIKLWEDNENRYTNNNKLKTFLSISTYNKKSSYFLLFTSLINQLDNKYSGITKDFLNEIRSIEDLGKKYINTFEDEDINKMREVYKTLKHLQEKYSKKEINIILNNKIINTFSVEVENYKRNTNSSKSTDEKNYNNYITEISNIASTITKQITFDNSKQVRPFEDFKEFEIAPIDYIVGEYHFISKVTNQIKITADVIEKFIKNKIDMNDIYKATKSQVLSNIKTKRFNEKVCNNLSELKNGLLEDFASVYFKTTVEIKHGDDNLREGNSAGINALYYLDICSNIFDKKLFIIDQPEDDVSQTKINSVLLNSLNKFSKKAQVIIVTHNPQLVVNLDVDNVIVINRNEEKNEISFTSGPLERLDCDVDMIKLVANTLEGGIDVIKKRWKRYDKTNKIRN